MLRGAAEVDEEEDRRYGVDKRGDELPAELSFREGRLKKMMSWLEAEAQAEAERAEAAYPTRTPEFVQVSHRSETRSIANSRSLSAGYYCD